MTKVNENYWDAVEQRHIATCGHEDSLGYFANTVCGKCAKRNHRKAVRGGRR